MHVKRLLDHPIIGRDTDPSIGENIQGPSLIRVPDWVNDPLGRYYLYFADHKGTYIRLAYSDALTGPWRIYQPGSLQLSDSHFPTKPPDVPPDVEDQQRRKSKKVLSHNLIFEGVTVHIASPDVHIDHANRAIVMYYHGLEGFSCQRSRAAISADGIHFEARPEILGPSYMRIFRYDGFTYALAMPGRFFRSTDGLSDFKEGPLLFNKDMRHSAVVVRDRELMVFWTQVGDTPERIQLSSVDLRKDWKEWRETEPVEVIRPVRDWEGAKEPPGPSVRSVAYGMVNQLRDPAVFEEAGKSYLLYAVAGESGIAIAEISL